MDQICPKGVFPVESGKSEQRDWILHIRIRVATNLALNWQFWFFGPNVPKKGTFGRKQKSVSLKFIIKTVSLNSKYSNEARCHISSCYGTSRPIKRELTIYFTARPRVKFASEKTMALLGQTRDSWPSMAPLGHVELTKMQKLLESKSKNENDKQNENKNKNSFWFSFSFLFSFCFSFSFSFSFLFVFVFVFFFVYVFIFVFAFVFIFIFVFVFVFTFIFVYVFVFVFLFFFFFFIVFCFFSFCFWILLLHL